MFWTIALEILFLWVCYAAYMAVLVHRRGPVGGLFFYPQAMIDRVKALGMISEEEFRKRKRFAFTLLIAWMLVIPGIGGTAAGSFTRCSSARNSSIGCLSTPSGWPCLTGG